MQCLWPAAVLSMLSILGEPGWIAPFVAPVSQMRFDVRGVVRVEATGKPIAGAVVSIESRPKRRTLTNADGSYRLDSLPLGAYVIDARQVGYYVERRELTVNCEVTIVDSASRRLGRDEPCDSARQILNFQMRPRTYH